MYRGFNLKLDDLKAELIAQGKSILAETNKAVLKELKRFINVSGTLNGSKMQEDWFPQINADVFISHSHKNEDKAIAIVALLRNVFGITAFVDSSIWNNSEDLLRLIDDEHCYNSEKNTYNYQKRNQSTSHVHMMLAVALSKMINKAECLFFLNTDDSVSSEDIVDRTASPWIYSEIAISQLMQKPLKFHRNNDIDKTFSERKNMNESLMIEYEIGIDSFLELNILDLYSWADKWIQMGDNQANPLDLLYQLFPVQGRNTLFQG